MTTPTSSEAWEYALKFLKDYDLAKQELYLTSGIVEQINELQKYKYVDGGRQQGKSYISAIEINAKYREKNMYHCRATERKLDDLKRCGCNRCYEEYRHLERDYYYHRERDYSTRNYYFPPDPAPLLISKELKMTETKPLEEPKNYAVKLLVDQLKAQQTTLSGVKGTIENYKNKIKTYQGYIKTQNASKEQAETKIKELSVALKKLGHKE